MKNFKNINQENGRSMIEMLGVLAIIGVLSVGGIAGYSKAMQKYRVNKAIEQITLIAGNIRTFFASQGNYNGLDSDSDTGKAIIKKAKLVPDEMLTISADGKITAITNSFGYACALDSTRKSGDDNQAFTIDYYIGIAFSQRGDEEVCIELLTHDWKAADVEFISLYHTDIALAVPVSIDDAVRACSKMRNERLIFYFDVDMNYYRTWDNLGLEWYN